MPLSDLRITALRYHAEQARLWASMSRFKTVPAGRRSGKTELAKRKLVKEALRGTAFPDPRFFAGAPTRDQAKRIFWEDLKAMINPRFLLRPPSESSLIIWLVNNTQIQVVGMDKPERIEGVGWDGGILDEYGNMKAKAWPENVRPTLSDRNGWCWLIGVPEGRNHYYTQDKTAKEIRAAWNPEMGGAPEWDSFHWISADILPPEEIAAAKRDLDELTYLQEYEASFVYFSGMAYYAFEERRNCARLRQDYNPRAPLIFALDFNVAPGVAAIGQEMRLPNGQPPTIFNERGEERVNPDAMGTGWIGEVHIPRGSNTILVCRRFIKDWGRHEGRVVCYGDATGGSEGSAKVLGSDWDLAYKILKPHFGDRLYFKVRSSNPRERARVNAVNSRLCSADKVVRMMVDPAGAPNLVKDFEGVTVVTGGSGEIDKKTNPELTHLTDAVGYYCEREYPVRKDDSSGSMKIGGS